MPTYDIVSTNYFITKKDTFLLLLSYIFFGLLSITWAGTILVNHHFMKYDDLNIVYNTYIPVFMCTYAYGVLFLVMWFFVLFKMCKSPLLVRLLVFVLNILTITAGSFALHAHSVDNENQYYREYQHGILIATIGQFVINLYYSYIFIHYKGERPAFCGVRRVEI